MIRTVKDGIQKLPFTHTVLNNGDPASRLKNIAAADKITCFQILESSESGLD